MTLDEALAQRGPLVAAWDCGGGGNVLLIVSAGKDEAKVLLRETVAPERRLGIEHQLAQHGIPVGSTYHGCEFVWVCTEAHLVVVRLGAGVTLQMPGAELVISGRQVAGCDVAVVQCFYNDDVTHRGVRVWLANGKALTIAEQHDPAEHTRNLDFFLMGSDWIFTLGEDLAARLGVPLHDNTWEGVARVPAPQRPADAATDALVDGLADAYLRWDDPDRVARRAARKVVEQERDKMILDLSYIESGQRGELPMDIAVARMAAHFAVRIERVVPDAGPFEAIHQPLPEIENGGYIALDLKPAAGNGRVLELRVESPSGEHSTSEALSTGTTAELVHHLLASTFSDRLLPIMKRLTDATCGSKTRVQGNPSPVNSRPRARSSAEMSFYASLHTCPQCTAPVDPAALTIYGDNTAWALTGKCTRCRHDLAYTFLTMNDDPILAPRELPELGRGRSEIIASRQFSAEIARLEPMLFADPTRLGPREWKVHREGLWRFRICIAELAKFFAPGSDAIAEDVLSVDDRNDRAVHPERYTRGWLNRMSEHGRLVSAGIIADLPRIVALDTLGAKRPKGIHYIEREVLDAHELWVERGKKGKGRLVVVGASHDALNIGRGIELSGARFFDTELPDVYLMDARLRNAELVETSFVRGKLYGIEFVRTTLTGGSFAGADLETADFSQATISGTDFSGAELHLSAWKGANVSCATFVQAEFGDAILDGAVFNACDFRGAVFAADDPDQPPSTKARFERCDFRDTNWQDRDLSGAVFVDCKLGSITGRPSSTKDVTIENADAATVGIPEAWRR